jgi:multicomponent Na+:H+ antiporter subunit E
VQSRVLLVNLALALVWCALNGFTLGNVVVGFVLGYALLIAARVALPSTDEHYVMLVPRVLRFSGFILSDLVHSSLILAYDVIHPRDLAQPRIIAYPLTATTDLEITLVACAISITPGSVSLDLSPDRRVLYVHAMYCPDEAEAIRSLRERTELPLLVLLRGRKEPS